MPKIVDLNRIYQSTVKVFTERGYNAATTKEIAVLAGVNEATLYRRFGTKDTLIQTALRQVLAKSPFGQLKGSEDPRKDISMIAKAYIDTFEDFGATVLLLITEAAKHPKIRPAMAALHPNLENAAQIIAHHQSAGRISKGSPMVKLLNLIAPLATMGFLEKSGLEFVPAIAEINCDRVADDFLNGHLV